MTHFKQLKRWPFMITLGLLITISAATTTVLANNDSLTVRANLLNVRLGPGLSYNAMGQVQAGTKLAILDEKNSWYQVRLAGNRIGWVASWLVDHTEASTSTASVYTVNSPVNVRQYASTDSKQLGRLNAGQNVNVLYTEKGWAEISYNNTAAWVAQSYLTSTGQTTQLATPKQTTLKQASTPATKPAAAKTTTATSTTAVITKIDSNLRAAPGLNEAVVARLKANTRLSVIKQSGDWYQVQTADGKKGFIAAWIVTTPNQNANTKAASSLSEATIVLDPGHGGSDVGALSTSEDYEKDFTLKMAKAVGSALSAKGAKVVYTRSDDTFVDLNPRPHLANSINADAFISIHFDSSANTNTASGFTSYYYSANKDKPLASSLDSALAKTISLTNRGVAFGDYEVLRDNQRPAVLLELGYINTDKDFSLISSEAYRSEVSSSVVTGLNNYFSKK